MNTVRVFKNSIILGIVCMAGAAFAAAASNTQSVSGGGVTTKISYLNPKSAEEPRFQIDLDTHSVNLDGYDFKSIVTLRDNSSQTYSPTNVEAKGGGHHRQAVLSFPRFSAGARKIEIIIKDVPGAKERTFVWNLE